MKFLAAVCGVLIVLLGLWSTGRSPTETQSAIEILCLVGGLILIFQGVVIARLDALARRLDAQQEGPVEEPPPDDPDGPRAPA